MPSRTTGSVRKSPVAGEGGTKSEAPLSPTALVNLSDFCFPLQMCDIYIALVARTDVSNLYRSRGHDRRVQALSLTWPRQTRDRGDLCFGRELQYAASQRESVVGGGAKC